MTDQQTYTVEELNMIKDTRRFDLRRIIGGVFVLYGVIVTIIGFAPTRAEMAMTGGININLWSGLGMLIVGILFFVWDHFAPVPAADIVHELTSLEQKRAEGAGETLPD